MTATRASAAWREGLDQYQAMGWGLISMKNDWKTIFPPLQ